MQPDPTSRCSRQWKRPDLPAWGTASRADFWVALEQPGPWGRKAITQSRLDPIVGAALEDRISSLGGRLVLVRRPGRHVDEGCSTPRTVVVGAGMSAGSPWTGETHLLAPGRLLELLTDFDPTAPRPAWLQPSPPALLVCTNGKRDQCCALEGRDLVGDLASGPLAAQVWEASHLGGHRFAPTAVVLPTNQSLARLDPTMAAEALAAAAEGRALAAGMLHDRGLSHLEPADQVVDAHLRATGQRAEAVKTSLEEQLPSSCGTDAVPLTVWQVRDAH